MVYVTDIKSNRNQMISKRIASHEGIYGKQIFPEINYLILGN